VVAIGAWWQVSFGILRDSQSFSEVLWEEKWPWAAHSQGHCFHSYLLGATAPRNHDSAFQTEAVLIVIVGADIGRTAIAKASVEILGLDGAQGDLFAQLNVESPSCRHGEGVLGICVAVAERVAIRGAALATQGDAHPTEVDFEEWPERAAAAEGEPRPEQIGEAVPVHFRAYLCGHGLAKILAATQVGRDAEQAGDVVSDGASTAGAVKALFNAGGAV